MPIFMSIIFSCNDSLYNQINFLQHASAQESTYQENISLKVRK